MRYQPSSVSRQHLQQVLGALGLILLLPYSYYAIGLAGVIFLAVSIPLGFWYGHHRDRRQSHG